MIIWAIILIIISLSLISGEFADTTVDFFINHAVVILLVAMGLLYVEYIKNKKE
ncbi:hypothetical protein J7L68_02365 [bacterium]|nr:hypothetical protein [bacterium]